MLQWLLYSQKWCKPRKLLTQQSAALFEYEFMLFCCNLLHLLDSGTYFSVFSVLLTTKYVAWCELKCISIYNVQLIAKEGGSLYLTITRANLNGHGFLGGFSPAFDLVKVTASP